MTGVDRSPSQLAEAERRRGDAEWPRLIRGDYRSCPLRLELRRGAHAVLSLGYLERDEDVGVLGELRRVVRSGGPLDRRDGTSRRLRPLPRSPRTWDQLPDGSLYLEERTTDWSAGTIAVRTE